MKLSLAGLFTLVLWWSSPALALENGVARTPPMGWNSWNKFRCNVSEVLLREMADAMVNTGMRDAGYVYLNVDDCWHGARDASGNIQPDKKRFPSGMGALANYVHAKGLRLGLYSDAGAKTCAKRPGSLGFEEQDAAKYASWGVDYLKYDWCNSEGLKAEEAYTKMRDALQKTGRKMVFSICEWGTTQPWNWAAPVGNLWRTSSDIGLCWDKSKCERAWETGIMNILDLQVGLEAYAGPGRWNDPDVLQVGNGMSQTEDRAHFSMWSILAAPLLAGNDLRSMTAETKAILTNRDVIEVNQDPLGVQGRKLRDDGMEEVWAKPLSRGASAVAFLNRGEASVRMQVRFAELGMNGPQPVRDLWEKKELGSFKEAFSAEVPPHGVVMVRVGKGKPAP